MMWYATLSALGVVRAGVVACLHLCEEIQRHLLVDVAGIHHDTPPAVFGPPAT